MSNTNLINLTKSHKAIAAKKKFKREQIKEILFDDDARREYLTGFRKRKLAKAEAARNKAKEKERQERLEIRREKRRELREKAIENAAQVEQACGAVIDTERDEEWSGIQNNPSELEKEYEDEEVLATVTIVEDFDPDTILHGPLNSQPLAPASESVASKPPIHQPSKTDAPTPSCDRPKSNKQCYETKGARKRERTKQRARRAEKAELAGGKAARKQRPARGPKGKGGLKR